MGITHIIRGDDHVSNTPKQLLFYEALGCEPPHFAHMPLMMGKDGSKLSKRHGAVSVSEYKNQGFLPEALSNYLILLGWSPGEGKEIIGLKDASGIFKVEDLGNVQARFDVDKLTWVNGEHIRRKDSAALSGLLLEKYPEYSPADKEYFAKVAELYKERLHLLADFKGLTECFFNDDFPEDPKARKKAEKYLADENVGKAFGELKDALSASADFSKGSVENICRNIAEKYNIKPAALIHPTRFAVSGMSHGAGLFEMMELLGKDRVLKRLGKI
jgi:glutamyl/glutaminyl-tRNA synthetase